MKKISNKNLTSYLKELEKEQIKSNCRRKQIIMIRVEINKIETRKAVEIINKLKTDF